MPASVSAIRSRGLHPVFLDGSGQRGCLPNDGLRWNEGCDGKGTDGVESVHPEGAVPE